MGQLSLLPLPAAMPEDVTITLAPSARALHAAKALDLTGPTALWPFWE